MSTDLLSAAGMRVLTLVVALALFISAPGRVLAAVAASRDEVPVAFMELKGELAERPSPFSIFGGAQQQQTLRGVLALFDKAAANGDYRGIVIRLRDPQLSMTQVEELSKAMQRARAAGKKVHLFADMLGPTELALGAAADEVILQAGGVVSLPGMYLEEMYLADTLALAGIKADMVQVGDYKGASEAMARNAPSKEWSQNIEGLLDGLYGQMRERIKRGRGLDDAALDKAMERAWMAMGDDAKAVGLIDAEVDWPEFNAHLAARLGGDEVAWNNLTESKARRGADMSNPFALLNMLTKPPEHRPKRATIAVVHIDGPIVDGDSKPAGLLGGSGVGSRTIRRALGELEDEDLVKGVIVRINSPGGSAIASEVIWRGVRRLSEKKPVWVSVGNMAASGGYYIAVAGDRIYVNDSSIVGSIGVVGGKLALGGLMEKLQVRVVGRGRGPMAGMFSSTAVWDERQREIVRAKMKETYDLFASRVQAGRNGIDLGTTAEGRLFTGAQAIGLKMADKVGTLEDAISDLAATVNLSAGQFDVMDYPAPRGLEEVLEEMFGGFGLSTTGAGPLAEWAAVLEQVLGPRAWPQVREHLSALLQLRDEPVLLIGPRAIIVR